MTPSQRVQKTSPLRADGQVYCNHGQLAIIRTSHTAVNPNRDFWTCRYPFGDPKRAPCKDFFYWVDDPMVRTPNRGSDAAQEQHSTELSSQTSVPETPGRSKRLEDIERGLQDRQTQSPNGTSQSPYESPTLGMRRSLTLQSPLPSSQTSTYSADVEEGLSPVNPPNQPYSFLGLYNSPVGSPVTPQKRRRQLDDDEHENYSVLLTPPETIHRLGAAAGTNVSLSQRPDPVTPTKNKGKARAFESVAIRAPLNEENPFVPSSAKASGSVPSLFHSPSSDTGATTAEQIAVLLVQAKQEVEKLQMTMEQLEQLGGTDYILRIERQKNALNASNEAKKERITELVAEVAALRNQVQRLTREDRI